MLKKQQIQTIRRKIFNKRILVFLILVLITEAIIVANNRGVIETSPFVIKVIDFFLITSISLLIANIFLRLTVGRMLNLFDGETEIEQRIVLSKVYSYFIYLLAFAVILSHIGVSIENITLFLGLVTTGIALAIKDIITSMFAWVILLSKKPFRIGDIIKIEHEVGEVTHIGTFYVALKVLEEERVVKIPSKMFLEKSIINYGKEKILKELKLPLEKILPALSMKDLEKRIQNNYSVENVQASAGLENGQLYLFVKIQLQSQRAEEITSSIIELLFKEYAQFIKKDKK